MRTAARLDAKATQRRWTEQSFYLVERDLLVGAFAVRRLVESFKAPDSVAAMQLPALQFSRTGKLADVYNKFEIWELFDLERPTRTTLGLRDFCNQLIHSWVLQLSFRELDSMLDGVFVASERGRSTRLLLFETGTIATTFRTVAQEDVVSSRMTQSPDGQWSYVDLKGPSDLGRTMGVDEGCERVAGAEEQRGTRIGVGDLAER